MEEIKELPPGTRTIVCSHLEHKEILSASDNPMDGLPKIINVTVYLEEIPSEIGWHGTCSRCGSKYYSNLE